MRGLDAKTIVIDTLLPADDRALPVGRPPRPQAAAAGGRAIDGARSTLVFTNVRSPAEIWYQAMLEARPDGPARIALHHGSLEREVRDWVEDGLRTDALKAVVCTSSLDLGVDFPPVERVLQIG